MQDEITIIPSVCAFHCTVCEGTEHHWLPESDDEINEGEPFMQCKHCNAVREIEDDEEWD